MNTRQFAALLMSAVLFCFAAPASADNEEAVKTIAGILMNLNHFPSADEKETLAKIAEDEAVGQAFRAVALAVHNMQHSATAADKERLSQILASDMAAAEAKALAEIVMGINHMPSAEAKASLQAMI